MASVHWSEGDEQHYQKLAECDHFCDSYKDGVQDARRWCIAIVREVCDYHTDVGEEIVARIQKGREA